MKALADPDSSDPDSEDAPTSNKTGSSGRLGLQKASKDPSLSRTVRKMADYSQTGQQKKSSSSMIMIGAVVLIVLIIAVVAFSSMGGSKTPSKPVPAASAKVDDYEMDKTMYFRKIEDAPADADLYMDKHDKMYVDVNKIDPAYRNRYTKNPNAFVKVKR